MKNDFTHGILTTEETIQKLGRSKIIGDNSLPIKALITDENVYNSRSCIVDENGKDGWIDNVYLKALNGGSQ